MKNSPMATRKKASRPRPAHSEDDLRTGLEKAGGFLHEIFARFPAILKVERSDVLLMHDEIDQGARIQSLPCWLFLFASCGIATMGLIINSPAVIIGAMSGEIMWGAFLLFLTNLFSIVLVSPAFYYFIYEG
jgi:hypothetical protein